MCVRVCAYAYVCVRVRVCVRVCALLLTSGVCPGRGPVDGGADDADACVDTPAPALPPRMPAVVVGPTGLASYNGAPGASLRCGDDVT